MPKPSVIDIACAIGPGLAALGIVGELDVRSNGSRSTSWIGKPGGEDQMIVVSITPMPVDEPVAEAFMHGDGEAWKGGLIG